MADHDSNTLIFSFGNTPTSMVAWADDVVSFHPTFGFTQIVKDSGINPSEKRPQARSGHVAAVLNGTYFVGFGLLPSFGTYLSDIWALELATLTWNRIDSFSCESNEPMSCPKGRYRAGFVCC